MGGIDEAGVLCGLVLVAMIIVGCVPVVARTWNEVDSEFVIVDGIMVDKDLRIAEGNENR